ncbi:SPFH domain-containing protein [Kineosporia sp. A_224]|uniref:SPFH domain-containing protein n=1 Tax=Kineosporia sp. A_224 TaxID=1962180 RepID=UPI000B4B1994|nr:SPFH domain-containing protein [Kineosporia sp. A_224]
MSSPTLTPGSPGEQLAPPVATARAVDLSERRAFSASGWLGVAVVLACGIGELFLVRRLADLATGSDVAVGKAGVVLATMVLLGLVALVTAAALVIIQPVETRVVQFLGRYVGTVRRTGFVLVTPLTTRRRVSVRVQNFETRTLKVNDADGNPVELAAIVVWQVSDTARSTFAVQNYLDFVTVQAEAAIRHVATSHPYDDGGIDRTSLRGSTDLVAAELATEVNARVAVAGVAILEVRISHLAYAPEIAQAMLQRQQAGAIVAARTRIVDGAVGMVELALARLRENDVVELDEERKAAMVSNLLVVLCGDSRATPVVNTGTLYT